MTTITKPQALKAIQKAVKHLSYSDFVQFFEWCVQYEEDAWDKKFREDVFYGKLDHIANRVLKDIKAGHCKEL